MEIQQVFQKTFSYSYIRILSHQPRIAFRKLIHRDGGEHINCWYTILWKCCPKYGLCVRGSLPFVIRFWGGPVFTSSCLTSGWEKKLKGVRGGHLESTGFVGCLSAKYKVRHQPGKLRSYIGIAAGWCFRINSILPDLIYKFWLFFRMKQGLWVSGQRRRGWQRYWKGREQRQGKI